MSTALETNSFIETCILLRYKSLVNSLQLSR